MNCQNHLGASKNALAAIADGSAVNVNASNREQSEIMWSPFCGERQLFFEMPIYLAECRTIGFVSVPQQIARCSVPGKGLGHLARKPILNGIWRDLKVDDPPAVNTQHDQGIEQLKHRRGDHEHVNRRNVRKVIAQKAPRRYAEDMAYIFEQYADAIITLSARGVAPEGLDATGDPVFCTLWTLTGLPAGQPAAARRHGRLADRRAAHRRERARRAATADGMRIG
jgi:hypothetical protein